MKIFSFIYFSQNSICVLSSYEFLHSVLLNHVIIKIIIYTSKYNDINLFLCVFCNFIASYHTYYVGIVFGVIIDSI